MDHHAHACERITEEEFDYQTSVTTRKEILKLVQSDAYKRAMRQKGSDAAAWNWQLYDKAQGIFPNEEAKASEEFDLADELDKADLSIGLNKRHGERL